MGEDPNQIERHIESTLSDLHGNVRELEGRVKNAMDWRTYFARSPMIFLGAAFGGGIFLSALLALRSTGWRS